MTDSRSILMSTNFFLILIKKFFSFLWLSNIPLYIYSTLPSIWASLVAQLAKNLPANAGDAGSIPGLGRPPGEGNGNPLQYSCLENSMDRGAWQARVHRVERVRHDLSCMHTHTHTIYITLKCIYKQHNKIFQINTNKLNKQVEGK